MPEYVYALHDFTPENDDEVPFRAGERIEILEKDEAYGDGWWQIFHKGRNLAGKVGLFPQSYTSPPSADLTEEVKSEAAAASSSLQPSNEESGSDSSPSHAPPAIYVNGNETGNGEVMKATMTDVQKAIEQLGRKRASSVEDGDGSHSFSFASTREDRDTDRESETDYDLSDTDNPEFGDEGHHKNTRQRLAEKARKALEEAGKLEMMMGGMGAGNRSSAPPIAVELSDESEGEDDAEDEDYTHTSSFLRRHSAIKEEDEDAETEGNGTGTAPSQTPQAHQDVTLPERDLDETDAPTATASSFPTLPSVLDQVAPGTKSVSSPTPVSPGFTHLDSIASTSTTTVVAASTPLASELHVAPAPQSPSPLRDSIAPSLVGLPSPTASSFHGSGRDQHNSLNSSIHSAILAAPTINEAESQAFTSQLKEKDSLDEDKAVVSDKEKVDEKTKEKTHPSEWTVEQVVDWARSKGFGEDVCEKFTEQEITGDVLLELDVNVLKNEIGIMAFGKRVRISNAISDLKRPPSSVGGYEGDQDHGLASSFLGMQSVHAQGMSPQLFAQQSPHSINSQPYSHPHSTHSRNISQSQSHHSYPGTLGSVGGFRDSRDSYSSAGANGALMTAAGLMSPESAPHSGDIPGSPSSPTVTEEAYIVDGPRIGLGLKGRPAHLTLSPSDSALNTSIETEEDRTALSEGETPSVAATQRSRRKLFGRSHDSTASGNSGKESKHSSLKEPISPIASPTASKDSKEKEDERRQREGKGRSCRSALAQSK
ncbi:hypothetical protein D9757_003677 [Collybiopsis confluens]|uniref:Uncharacterized protein n=1 Tax=Collybiopsis confluens TaxID=2823264 RepID=A0A8H5MDD8_9AGAR|nr:hypothetical protein D9757_003677 [Collybiopsis confluens]